MPIDNSVALGVKSSSPLDALDKMKKSIQAVADTTSILGRGMKTVENAVPDAPLNIAFPNRDRAHK